MKPLIRIVFAAVTGLAVIAAASHAMTPQRSEAAAERAWRAATEPSLSSFVAAQAVEYRIANDGAAAATYRDRSRAQ